MTTKFLTALCLLCFGFAFWCACAASTPPVGPSGEGGSATAPKPLPGPAMGEDYECGTVEDVSALDASFSVAVPCDPAPWSPVDAVSPEYGK